MKKFLNKNNFFYGLMTLILVSILGLVWLNISKGKPVNLDRNAGLNSKDNKVFLKVETLKPMQAMSQVNLPITVQLPTMMQAASMSKLIIATRPKSY